MAARGYDPIDLIPRNNLLIDPRFGLKLFDFEFARHRPEVSKVRDSWCLNGVPAEADGDLPVGASYLASPYATEWVSYTGLGLDAFLDDPAWLQRIKRMVNWGVLCACLCMRKLHEKLRLAKLRRHFNAMLGRVLPR